MSHFDQENYSKACGIMLDALKKTSDQDLDWFSSLTASLVCAMSAAFGAFPTVAAADSLISWARETALENESTEDGESDG